MNNSELSVLSVSSEIKFTGHSLYRFGYITHTIQGYAPCHYPRDQVYNFWEELLSLNSKLLRSKKKGLNNVPVKDYWKDLNNCNLTVKEFMKSYKKL